MAKPKAAVLVTGGAGYIGSHTCKALANAGFTPVTYDNLVHGHSWAVRWGPLVRGDLANQALLADTLRRYSITAVIHFAAFAYVGESMSAPGKYFGNNVSNTLTLLEAMQQAQVDTMVFSSTCATYGMPDKLPIDESQTQKPINPYGESKLFAERMLQWWGNAHGLRWTALRYFNAAGADRDGDIGEDHQPETHLIPIAIQAAMGLRAPLDIFGCDYPTPDGTAVRDYVHVSDLATAHVAALKRLQRGGDSIALNLGTGTGHSVRDVVSMVEVFGGRVPVRMAARRLGDPPLLVAAANRAREVLEWEPRHSSLDEIVSTAWRWHAHHNKRPARVGSTVHESVGMFPIALPVAP
jgi:UDP-glucose-4-epimerase GalE